jgi:hypothetical protein
VKVGETIKIPFPLPSSSNMNMTGDLTVTFGDIEDLTVPAGTYRVFKIDIQSNDLSVTMNVPASSYSASMSFTTNMDMHYQLYMENGTLRQIKSDMQYTVSYESTLTGNYAMHLTMDMILKQHFKP